MRKMLLLFALVFTVMGNAWAQRIITGTVTDEGGEPLIGASVFAKGTTLGTVTDIDGTYSLQVSAEVTTLVFSYTGYASKEVGLGASNVVDVALEESVTQLSEIVVVGYGTQIKSTLTGNIAKLGGDKIENLPVPSVEQALQGRTSGVFVEAVNGKPGGAVRVRIRGASSITASNQPLYVIDGIPVTTESQNNSGAALNPLADLNFNDVESIEILKDASAGAIYGSRAANGVVLITTKKGKQGKTRVEANFQTGFSRPTGKREFLNTDEYLELFNRAAVGAGKYEFRLGYYDTEQEAIDDYIGFAEGRFTRYSAYDENNWKNKLINTNWQDEAFQDAVTNQASLSASGGTDRTRFFTSAAWSNQEGILIGNGFERMSARLNLDQKASDKVNFGINMSLARTFTDQVSGDNAFSTPLQLVAMSPLTPTRNNTNETIRGYAPGQLFDRPVTTYYNGLIDQEDAQRDVTSFRTLANGYMRYQVLEGLLFNAEVGADVYTLRDNAFYGKKTDGGNATNGYGTSLYSQIANWTSKAFVNYDKQLASKHNLSLTAGTEFQKSRTDRTTVDGQEFPVDDLKTIASAADIAAGSSSITEFTFLSYFGRATYDFDRKYLLTVSGRVDGSSRFGKNNRYGFFPAVSAGWVLTEEPFLKDNSLLSFLKLRASYGVTGNAAIGNFDHLGLYGAEGYNGVSGLFPSQIPNPDLEWEKTAQIDAGIDFGFFDNRLNGEIDYYVKNTTDLLLNVPVPGTSGFRTQTQNVGEIQNKGVEVVLNSNNLVGAFKWNTSLNVALNKNKVVALAEGQDIINPDINVVKVGEPIGVFYGAEYAGVDPANGDALWYVNAEGRERETTSDFNEAEFVVLGSPIPDVIAGVTNTFTFKGFSLDFTFQGVFGNEIHNSAGRYMSCNACWFDNQTRDQMRYWDKPGDITDIPEPRLGYSNGDQDRSSRYITDGSYVRLRTLNFGYEFPQSVIRKAGLSRLRLYLLGQNLLTFTKYEGWDPEVSSDDFVDNIASGIDFYAAPQPKTITFGLNIGF
ncbi:MAG: TonB-dependent receptor SusC [Haliscomenobacter sp.]|nr:TonB-dependent receptor SusC [Haliscomenobacter sp.]